MPSVYVGDLFFLPVMNYYMIRYLQIRSWATNTPMIPFESKRAAVGASLAAIGISGYAHYSWTQDPYLGYIDMTLGALSGAGWWHLAFTAIQMSAIFIFVLVWIGSIRKQVPEPGLRSARLAWRLFMWYSFLSIADFAVVHLYVLPRQSRDAQSVFIGWQGLLVIPFWFFVHLYDRLAISGRGGRDWSEEAHREPKSAA